MSSTRLVTISETFAGRRGLPAYLKQSLRAVDVYIPDLCPQTLGHAGCTPLDDAHGSREVGDEHVVGVLLDGLVDREPVESSKFAVSLVEYRGGRRPSECRVLMQLWPYREAVRNEDHVGAQARVA